MYIKNMQHEISTADGGAINYISSPSFNKYSDESIDYTTSLFSSSSIFPPKSSLLSLHIPSDIFSTDDDDDDGRASFRISRFLIDHRDLSDRLNSCLSHLREVNREAESLRRLNLDLRMANIDLNHRLTVLVRTSYTASFTSSVFDDFSHSESSDESPISVIQSDRVERMDAGRVSLPKSISVRSSGYKAGRVRAQKLCLPGVEKKEEEQPPVELEVYNQGMHKTELCNKWQMTGSCPYRDRCQFAHGVEELRPIVRHPRYKTQLCRLILSGGSCPFSDRCHFRHTLTH